MNGHVYRDLRGAVLYAKLIARLCSPDGGSLAQLADYSGLSYATVQRYVKALRLMDGVPLHIVDFIEDRRGYLTIPVFRMDGTVSRDMVKPKPMSTATASRRYRQRAADKARRVSSVFGLAPAE